MWRSGLNAPRLVGSSRTRDRTHVPCISRGDSQLLEYQGSLWCLFRFFLNFYLATPKGSYEPSSHKKENGGKGHTARSRRKRARSRALLPGPQPRPPINQRSWSRCSAEGLLLWFRVLSAPWGRHKLSKGQPSVPVTPLPPVEVHSCRQCRTK